MKSLMRVLVFAAALLLWDGCATLVHWYAGTNDLPTKDTLPPPAPTNTAGWPVYQPKGH